MRVGIGVGFHRFSYMYTLGSSLILRCDPQRTVSRIPEAILALDQVTMSIVVTCMVVTWCCSFPNLIEFHDKEINVNSSFHDQELQALLDNNSGWSIDDYNSSESCIGGLLDWEVTETFTHLSLLSKEQRIQYRFWKSLWDMDLGGRMYIVNIRAAGLCSRPVALQQCRERRPTGFFIALEHGQPDNLYTLSGSEQLRELSETIHVCGSLAEGVFISVCGKHVEVFSDP